MTLAQLDYDLTTPEENPLTDLCSNLEYALHKSFHKQGFDVDGLEVEPDGIEEVLVSCSVFPVISLKVAALNDMVAEYAGELTDRLMRIK